MHNNHYQTKIKLGINKVVCKKKRRSLAKMQRDTANLFFWKINCYTGCPKKAERSIFSTLIFKNMAYFDIIR